MAYNGYGYTVREGRNTSPIGIIPGGQIGSRVPTEDEEEKKRRAIEEARRLREMQFNTQNRLDLQNGLQTATPPPAATPTPNPAEIEAIKTARAMEREKQDAALKAKQAADADANRRQTIELRRRYGYRDEKGELDRPAVNPHGSIQLTKGGPTYTMAAGSGGHVGGAELAGKTYGQDEAQRLLAGQRSDLDQAARDQIAAQDAAKQAQIARSQAAMRARSEWGWREDMANKLESDMQLARENSAAGQLAKIRQQRQPITHPKLEGYDALDAALAGGPKPQEAPAAPVEQPSQPEPWQSPLSEDVLTGGQSVEMLQRETPALIAPEAPITGGLTPEEVARLTRAIPDTNTGNQTLSLAGMAGLSDAARPAPVAEPEPPLTEALQMPIPTPAPTPAPEQVSIASPEDMARYARVTRTGEPALPREPMPSWYQRLSDPNTPVPGVPMQPAPSAPTGGTPFRRLSTEEIMRLPKPQQDLYLKMEDRADRLEGRDIEKHGAQIILDNAVVKEAVEGLVTPDAAGRTLTPELGHVFGDRSQPEELQRVTSTLEAVRRALEGKTPAQRKRIADMITKLPWYGQIEGQSREVEQRDVLPAWRTILHMWSPQGLLPGGTQDIERQAGQDVAAKKGNNQELARQLRMIRQLVEGS